MTAHTHQTVPTQFVEANGIRFAYRGFGKGGGEPLVFMQHFRSGMDHWDPAVTDGFAENRPVILFDNAGVASSSGETPDTIDAMAEHAACACRKSNPNILVVQPAQDRAAKNGPGQFDGARDRRILLQR